MDTMEIDDTAYMDRNLITQVNFCRRNQILRGVTVCLGLLCAFLLVANIGQFIFYELNHPESADQTQANYDALTQDKENLQNDNDNLIAEKDRLQSSYDALRVEKRQLQTILSNLTKEKDKLQQHYSSLIAIRDELKASFSNVKNESDQLQTSYHTLKQEKNQLEENYSNMQRSLEELQTNQNNLTATAEQLQTNYRNVQKEKDALNAFIAALTAKEGQLESNYTLLKREKDQLQISYKMLNRSKNQIDTSYNSLWKDKRQLQTSYNTLRKEKEQLQTNYSHLVTTRQELQRKIEKMSAKVKGMPCQTHWRKFDVSCYFVSPVKKNWTESRQACITEGADLLIIDSSEEQQFVNGLLGKGQNAWIGLTDSLEEGIWTWVDGTPVTTTYWQPGQPNDFRRNQDCGEYVSSDVGTWNDDGCFAEQFWICEK